MRRLLNLSAGLEWVLLWRIVYCNCMKGMSVESDNWLLMDGIRTVSQNIWQCKAGVCLVSDPSSRLHLCTYVRTNIHSYLFCVWCAVTFSLASVVLGFLVVHVTTFTHLFCCVVCCNIFTGIPGFRVPDGLCHYTHTRKPSCLHLLRDVWHIIHIVMKFNIVDIQIMIMSLVERQ